MSMTVRQEIESSIKECRLLSISFDEANERIIKKIGELLKEAYTDGFGDSKFDFDAENYID